MKEFQVKNFEMSAKRPSLNSVIEQRKRLAQQQVEQDALLQQDTYTETEAKLMQEASSMSVVDHLSELRTRLVIAIVAIIIGTLGAYYYVEDILQILVAPAGKLYYTKPTEAFFTYMKISLVAGCIVSSPVWFYQIWAFIVPALSKGEKRVTFMVVPTAVVLFVVGVLFSYYLVLPMAIQFFIGFGTDELQPLFSIGQYIDFVIAFILPFGITFELPLILIALGILGILSSDRLREYRKMFILLAFIIGAAISPTPDMLSQTMIAGPMILLYEISYGVLRYIVKV
ncbi:MULTISPECIES: twin-arginine translocase subunit TatC [unclassified Veillonella]|jgi:twin arginine-targeting protein translocase tatC|uniref:twin-arginine translocase subunit TatC n=1 Tax=unclassified Veillonella TaxID=2630086 RepID=UPI00021A1CB5|nr:MULTISPECIES: twin-arginine translocase subunit TatC [unclassified Veillonella]EGS37252.1 twin arginine-targeting protein translocase TatC [Veillonella sp. oral taxon 780 str. F0422]